VSGEGVLECHTGNATSVVCLDGRTRTQCATLESLWSGSWRPGLMPFLLLKAVLRIHALCKSFAHRHYL
jgi:hypothetical protein